MNESPAESADPADPAANHGPPPRRRGPRRAVRRGTEREAVLGVSADERPTGWSEGADAGVGVEHGPNGERGGSAAHGSNDERLQQDVPPHWA